jgi:hypothetical protein
MTRSRLQYAVGLALGLLLSTHLIHSGRTHVQDHPVQLRPASFLSP